MPNVLFVKGHPGTAETSISVRLAEAFLETYRAGNPSDTVQVLDLYRDDVPLIDADVLSAWAKQGQGLSETEAQKTARMAELQDQFLQADKVIFAAPMWNFGYPPMVKAYMDAAIVVGGKTFGYTEAGPVGLLKGQGRKALILEASGTHFSGTPAASHTHASNHLKGVLHFIGIEDVQVIAAEGVGQFPAKRDEIVGSATDRAQNLAASF